MNETPAAAMPASEPLPTDQITSRLPKSRVIPDDTTPSPNDVPNEFSPNE